MIIAYDLRYAADHFTGIGTHAACLFEALLSLPGDERYVAIWNPDLVQSRFDPEKVRSNPRVRWIECSIPPVHPTTAWRTGGLLRRIVPDVYFSPYYLLPWYAPCPSVLTIHDVRPLRYPEGLSWAQRWMYRWAITAAGRAHTVLTSSESSRREIVALSRIPAARLGVVPPGIPPSSAQSAPRRPAALGDGRFALVVGENRPHKNLRVLAQAWALPEGERPALPLVSAGPIDARHPGLDALAEGAGARDVIALGRVAQDELEWLYEHASVVLFPTLYEGFGFPLVEGLWKGRSVIASRIPVLTELSAVGVRFCDPHDPQEWARAVREVVGDPQLPERIRAARPELTSRFSYERVAAQTLEAFRGCAGRA